MGIGKGILLDDNFELQINVVRDSNGLITSGLTFGDITRQNQKIILLAEKGEIKEVPTMGVGIASFLDDDNPLDLLAEINENLCNDDQTIKTCVFNITGKLIIDAGY
jgi:hypothetical protein